MSSRLYAMITLICSKWEMRLISLIPARQCMTPVMRAGAPSGTLIYKEGAL